MHGVVSLLDDVHYALVEKLWDELAQKFDVRGIYVTPFPHFSYQVAESYDVEAVESVLRDVAGRTRPFRVRTAGLGIFTVASPILHIPIVRSPELTAFHAELWRALPQTPTGKVAAYYQPEAWVPHITLAHGDVDAAKVGEVIARLSARNFHWEITVNNLSLIYDTGTEQGLRCRFNFDGRA
jgi:2'-5' RNA ligase